MTFIPPEPPWWLERDPRPIDERLEAGELPGARVAEDAFLELRRWCHVSGEDVVLIVEQFKRRVDGLMGAVCASR